MREGQLTARLFRAVCLSFSVILLVLTLLTQIQLVRTRSRIKELESAVDRAENTRILLQIKTCAALNLEELERRAVQELGMRHPEPGQIIETNYLG